MEGDEGECLSKNSLARAVRISRRDAEKNATRHAQLSLSSWDSHRQVSLEPAPSSTASLPDGENPQEGQARANCEPHSRQNRTASDQERARSSPTSRGRSRAQGIARSRR